METLFGHTQRSMVMLLSARSCLLSGYHPSLRKLSSSGIAKFHGSIWLQGQVSHENAPLTLASLGFGDRYEAVKKDRSSKLGSQTPTSRISSNKAGAASLRKQIVRENGPCAIVSKNEKSNKLFDLAFSNGIPSNSEESGKNHRLKTGNTKEVFQIDSAIFAAKSFFELDLPPLLLKRLDEEGLTAPTEVQATAVPMISLNHDVVIQSYTGSGKTFAYLLPILSRIGPLKRAMQGDESENKQGIEAVIVAPSRELGMQIVREVEKLLGPANKKFVQQLVGGANRSRQEEALKKNKPLIVVGTPGRISEISAAGRLHTHSCRFLVLDEVDQLLSFTFREDMHRILEHVGRKASGQPSDSVGQSGKRTERQLIMVSATIPFSVVRAARSWGNDPLLIKAKSVAPLDLISVPGIPISAASDRNTASISNSVTQAAVDSLPPGLKHYYCVTKAQHKVDMLRRCVHALEAKSVIAFMNHSKQLKDVVFKLEARGMKAADLHGDLGKLGRSTTLKNFKNGDVRVLVTNELSARGLDVFECDLVVNLGLPTDSVHYAHRAGRTGRLGRKGNVVTLCEEPELFIVKKLRRQLGIYIQSCEFTEGKFVVSNEEEEKERSADTVE